MRVRVPAPRVRRLVGIGGLDDEKLSLLERWADGLCRDQRAEVAAAGRAIELLIDEIERLNVLLWDGPLGVVPTTLEPSTTDETVVAVEPELPTTLADRLKERLASPHIEPA
jgi:hypothetical protein